MLGSALLVGSGAVTKNLQQETQEGGKRAVERDCAILLVRKRRRANFHTVREIEVMQR